MCWTFSNPGMVKRILSEPVFVDLLTSPGTGAGTTNLFEVPARRVHRLAESNPWNRFLGSWNFTNSGSEFIIFSTCAANATAARISALSAAMTPSMGLKSTKIKISEIFFHMLCCTVSCSRSGRDEHETEKMLTGRRKPINESEWGVTKQTRKRICRKFEKTFLKWGDSDRLETIVI